jgi:hypothetical protein
MLHVSLGYPCLCHVSCVLSAACVSGLSMLTHKTQEKDMDNPETHVALNTQDTGERHG